MPTTFRVLHDPDLHVAADDSIVHSYRESRAADFMIVVKDLAPAFGAQLGN
jgi:hypothetical protein